MKIINNNIICKMGLLSIGLIANIARAEVIELDNQNVQNCQQQLFHSKSYMGMKHAIIFDYSPTCGACHTYEPIFVAVSDDNDYRDKYSFFKINQRKASQEVLQSCLHEGYTSSVPRTTIRQIINSPYTNEEYVANPIIAVTGIYLNADLKDIINSIWRADPIPPQVGREIHMRSSPITGIYQSN